MNTTRRASCQHIGTPSHALRRRVEGSIQKSAHCRRGNRGFSLTELLAVLAIMTLVGMVVATCIPSAHRAYVATTDASNAQVILSTASSRLRDVLSVADPDTVVAPSDTDDFLTQFKSMETGYTTSIKNDNTAGLLIQETNSLGVSPSAVSLVPQEMAKSKSASSDAMHVKADSIAYDPATGVFTVTNLQVVRGASEALVGDAKIDTIKVKVLAPHAVSG